MQFARTTLLLTVLAACDAPVTSNDPDGPDVLIDMGEIETDSAGRCFTRDAAPTEIRIVEEAVIVVPEKRDSLGRVTQPAVIRSQDGPQTFRIGEGTRFETLCPQLYSATLVSSLQRALQARGAYGGPITGTYDTVTSTAVRNFQLPSGIDSPLLRSRTALELGLTAVPRH